MSQARADTYDVKAALEARGVTVTFEQANTLRRAELTLRRWAEQECGDGNAHASWAIERDEETGKPYRVTYPHQGTSYRKRIADREAGALRRVAAVCKAAGLHYYHQGDPRGCALHVGAEPLDFQTYTSIGVACCGEG